MKYFSLTSCHEGFGEYFCFSDQREGEYDKSTGYLTFLPVSPSDSKDIVDKIATLLTSGRMSDDKREYLRNVYDSEVNKDAAFRRIQELAVFVPEFHTTGLDHQTEILRPIPKVPNSACKPYKAVIHLLLHGGMDSFNLLVPHSGCGAYGKF
jgi:hypothetical protein